MSERATELADEFGRVAAEVIAAAEECSDDAWRLPCEGEGWTVGAVFRHIAWAMEVEVDGAVAFIDGAPLPAIYESWEHLHQLNHTQSVQFANAPRGVTLGLLRTNARNAEAFIRSVTDAELQRERVYPLAGERWTGDNLIEYVLIGHPTGHLESITAALRA